MSGDQHNQADPLDLDAIERDTKRFGGLAAWKALALVAEVRRLRADNARLLALAPRGMFAP